MLRVMAMTTVLPLKRTPMMRICTTPFYAEVVWRGRPGAEICGVFFDPFSRGERAETGLSAKYPGAGSWKNIEAGVANRQCGWGGAAPGNSLL